MTLLRAAWSVILLLSMQARAQENAEPLPMVPVAAEEHASPESPPVLLDDIVVTATKHPEASRDLAATVVGIGGAGLDRSGDTELRDVLRRIPGVSFTELLPDLGRISIRGIQADVSAVTPETEGVFIDDVPMNDPFLMLVRPDVPLFDLDHIEVMKGPQGTLFGGSGLAGAIRYQLNDAAVGEWEARGFSEMQTQAYGSPSRVGGAALNLPLGDAAAVRLVGVQRNTGGTIDDTRNGLVDTDHSTSSTERALVRWAAADGLSVGAKVYQQEGHADDLPWADTLDGRLERSQRLQESPSNTKFQVGSFDIHWRMVPGELTSVTGLMRKASNQLNAYGDQAMGTQDAGQPVTYPTSDDTQGLTQEIRLSSLSGAAWQWLVGLYGQRYHSVSFQHFFVDNGTPSQSLLDFASDVTAREGALFGETSFDLWPAIRATLGARAYQVVTEGTVDSSGPVILATGNTENHNDASEKASGVNPKLALEWEATRNVRAYVSASRGFRFGGIQLVGPSPAAPDVPETYQSDSVWNYEAGWRTDWLGGALRADGAGFLLEWKNPQVQMSTTGAVALNIIDNADSARSQGAELALRYQTPIDGLEADVSAAYTDARITAPYEGQGQTVPEGSRLPGYSNFQLAADLQYGFLIGAVNASASIAYQHQGKGTSDILQTMAIYGLDTVDLRLNLSLHRSSFQPELNVGVANLFDQRAVMTAVELAQGSFATVYNRPRTLDVRVALSF